MADYVHSLGLKLGLYSDIGTATCSGYPALQGYMAQDVQQFADWGTCATLHPCYRVYTVGVEIVVN